MNFFRYILFAITCALSFTAQSSVYYQAAWYVSFDVTEIKTKLAPMGNPSVDSNDFNFSLHVPEEIQNITVYGDKESQSFTAVLSGNLRHFSVLSYLEFLADEAGEVLPVKHHKSSKHAGQIVNHYQFNNGKESKSFYSSHINDQTLAVSFSQEEVHNWIDGKNDLASLHHTGLISVEVNIESAMVHAGADIEQGQQPFHSQMFKKIKKLAASAIESQGQMLVEANLLTEDAATATQVQAVINGLIAMNALSDIAKESEDLKTIIENLSVSVEDNQVQLFTQFPTVLIADGDID